MAHTARVVMRIETDDTERRHEAHAIARRLGLRVGNETGIAAAESDELILAAGDDGLELRASRPAMRPGTGVRVDFGWLAGPHVNLSRRQPLAKAVGRNTRSMLDATAGLGQDAALLAAMGFQVMAVERNPVLATMLSEAVRDAAREPRLVKALGDRLDVHHGEAREVIQSNANRFDCIYIDPMFPPKRKASALASKEIRLVRALVGDDGDAGTTLEIARENARRVVVKRPTHAAPLGNNVTASVASKLVRYDLYVRG